VKFPCGCEITDAHLVCICIMHLAEYNTKKREYEERREKFHREMREAIEKAVRSS
jgi:hypothetical protein